MKAALYAGDRTVRIITHAFPLDQAQEACRLFDSGQTGEVTLHPHG